MAQRYSFFLKHRQLLPKTFLKHRQLSSKTFLKHRQPCLKVCEGKRSEGGVTESLCLKETFHEDEGHEAEQEGVGSLLLIAVGVSLGYHLVACHV